MNDIDIDSMNWLPIGISESDPFLAILEGNDHRILNLKINRNVFKTIGLVGNTRGNAIIRNLHITGKIEYTGTSDSFIGALVGKNNGIISDCSANINLSSISNVDSMGGWSAKIPEQSKTVIRQVKFDPGKMIITLLDWWVTI